MVHGEMFSPVIDILAQDYTLIVPDMRGTGLNRELEGPYTISQYADDMAHVLDEMGLDRAHILGYSMGGTVAQQFAQRYPNRVKTLILSCTFAFKPYSALERFQRPLVINTVQRIGAEGIARFILPEVAKAALNLDPEITLWYREAVRMNRDDVLLYGIHEIFKFDSRAWLPKLKMPSLVMGASDDLLAPIHHTEMLTGLLPNAYTKVFEPAGHGVIITHAQEYARTVRHFLNIVRREEATGRLGRLRV
jgi:aminoacrylate hydrolase